MVQFSKKKLGLAEENEVFFGAKSSAVGPGGVRGLKPFKLETGENQLLVV